jgi:hypothetical protein
MALNMPFPTLICDNRNFTFKIFARKYHNNAVIKLNFMSANKTTLLKRQIQLTFSQ